MKLPDNEQLNIMWSVATSSAIESGERSHIIFAKLLYMRLTKTEPKVKLAD